jgi:hypothetical protein
VKNLFKLFPVFAALAVMSLMSCGEAENEISFDRYYESIFTVMLDADGKPLLWEG